jgi:transcriptional regulator with XRE-family HTH domain
MDGMTPAQRVIQEQGRSIAWIARKLGMDRTYVSRIIAFRRPMPPGFAESLATLLGVPVDFITPAEAEFEAITA